MVSASVLQAVIRAARPKFRNSHDRVAFAAHSFFLAEGYALVAIGKQAEEGTSDSLSSREEVPIDGWNEMSDAYAFAYTNPSGGKPTLVKGIVLGDQLLVHVLQMGQAAEPQMLELDVNKYTNSSSDLIGGYSDLDGLAKQLQQVLQQATASSSSNAAAMGQTSSRPTDNSSGREPSSNLHDDHNVGPRNPLLVEQGPRQGGRFPTGTSDVVPPGFPAPGFGPGPPGFGGLPGGRTGGMHMGPDDPLFAGQRGMGMGPGNSTLPPGARYDPIGPPGMPGFHPEDFTPGQRGIHPDLMQPGPGRGTDFDGNFG